MKLESMGLFKSKTERKLDGVIQRLEMNMSNNYKDNAQANLRELEDRINELRSNGGLKETVLSKYETMLGSYKEAMKGYSHKDQKPYWT